jgi:hypothetical protein
MLFIAGLCLGAFAGSVLSFLLFSGYFDKLGAVFLLFLLSSAAQASPYFRVLNYEHPVTVGGALIDPVHLGNTQTTALLPIFTHSPADGCILPSVMCEDWSPLAIGGSVNAGKFSFIVAPIANVAPWAQQGLLAVVPASWQGLRSSLTAPPSGLTFSGGPAWQYDQAANKGYFRVFTGLALTW